MNVQEVEAIAGLVTTVAPIMEQIIVATYSTVRGVEQAFPQSDGKTKLDAALGTLEAIFGPLVKTAGPLFTTLVNGAVAVLNAIGEFKGAKAGQPSSSTSPV